jgi:hypothetical protein
MIEGSGEDYTIKIFFRIHFFEYRVGEVGDAAVVTPSQSYGQSQDEIKARAGSSMND